MNNTQKHAKLELDILYKNIPDTCIKEFNTEILLLCKKFGNSGQSGGSAPYTARILADTIKKLLLRETITPIFNNEEDWVNVSEIMSYENFYQNKRNGSIFKEGL